MEEVNKKIQSLEERLKALEENQKQDADELVGVTGDLLFRTEEIEAKVTQLEQDFEAYNYLAAGDAPP